MLVEVGALISWCIYSYRIVMLLVPYMWASMTFLPILLCGYSVTVHAVGSTDVLGDVTAGNRSEVNLAKK